MSVIPVRGHARREPTQVRMLSPATSESQRPLTAQTVHRASRVQRPPALYVLAGSYRTGRIRATASAVGQAAEGPSTAVQTPISSSELHYLWAPAVVAGMVAIMPSPAAGMVAAYLALQWLAPAWALAGLLCSCTEANTGHVGRSLAAVAVAWFLVYRWGLRAPVAVSLPLPRIMAGLGRVQVTGPASLIKCILDHPAATANLQKAAAVASVSLAFLGSLRLLHRLPLQAVANLAASSLIAACRAANAYLQQQPGHSSQGPSLEPKGAIHDTAKDADSPGDAALQKRLLKHVKAIMDAESDPSGAAMANHRARPPPGWSTSLWTNSIVAMPKRGSASRHVRMEQAQSAATAAQPASEEEPRAAAPSSPAKLQEAASPSLGVDITHDALQDPEAINSLWDLLVKIEGLPGQHSKVMPADLLVQPSIRQQPCKLSAWLADQGQQLAACQKTFYSDAADAAAMAAARKSLQQQEQVVQKALACLEDFVRGPQHPVDLVVVLDRRLHMAVLDLQVLEVKPGHTYKGVAVLAHRAWTDLQTVETEARLKLSSTASNLEDPAVFAVPFAAPESLGAWLAHQAETLLAAEETLYNPCCSKMQYEDAFDKLCYLGEIVRLAVEAVGSWPDELAGDTVLHLHPAWAGYVPWSMILPGSDVQIAAQAAERLLLDDHSRQPEPGVDLAAAAAVFKPARVQQPQDAPDSGIEPRAPQILKLDKGEAALCSLWSLQQQLARQVPDGGSVEHAMESDPEFFSDWIEATQDTLETWQWYYETPSQGEEKEEQRMDCFVEMIMVAEGTIRTWVALGGSPEKETMPLDPVTLQSRSDEPLRLTAAQGRAMGMVPCEPAYVSAEEDYEQYARCKQAQLDSLAHCHEILDFLRDDLNLPGSYFGNPDPEGDTYENPLLTLPASWQPAGSKAPVLIGAAKQSDVERAYLCSLQSTLTAASVEPEEAAVAAAELQALELRLETAEAALCAWLEAGEAKHPEIPPLTLNQLKDNSSGLALFEEVLLRPWDTTTTSLRFIPIQGSETAARICNARPASLPVQVSDQTSALKLLPSGNSAASPAKGFEVHMEAAEVDVEVA